MVERALNMREVRGLIPLFSNIDIVVKIYYNVKI